SMGSEFLEMLHGPDGKIAMGGSGSGFKKIRATFRLSKAFANISKELMNNQLNLFKSEKPDRVIYHGKAIYGYIWGAKHPDKTFISTPIPLLYHPVKGKTHLVFNSNYGSFFNTLTYKLADFGLLVTLRRNIKRLNLDYSISKKQLKNQMKNGNSIYTLSPSLFSKPDYWNDNIKIVGYLEREKTANWKPTPELEKFISHHEKIMFVTFGSMTNPSPLEKTEHIIDILVRNKIPAIINTGEGGLVKPADFMSDLIYFTERIPYDWIFPKMHSVIHHGGAGTTHLTIKYGCSSMIIPHIIDQFMWCNLIAERNLGPKGIKMSKLPTNKLEPLLLNLFSNASYKKEAEKMGKLMRKENFEQEFVNFVETGN
ncbi:MAG: nucleotide disphospho-sugar-binding domain-containing protein, partial [Flavobacteriales bacterium]